VIAMTERQLATPCAWAIDCGQAVKERWDPLMGKYRPACKRHVALASPMELRELQQRAKDGAP
jgi:hypothetical protein